jgi:hypothetical protein
MIDITDVPAARPVPAARRAADMSLLAGIAASPGRQPRISRRGWTTAAVAACAVAACGTASAIVFLPAQPARVHDSARCYLRASTDFGDSFPGTTIAMAIAVPHGQPPPSKPPAVNVPAQAISVCGALWRQGFLRPGAARIARPAPGTHDPVPPLVACVLPSGQAAVFPGTTHTCARLGLPPMTR